MKKLSKYDYVYALSKIAYLMIPAVPTILIYPDTGFIILPILMPFILASILIKCSVCKTAILHDMDDPMDWRGKKIPLLTLKPTTACRKCGADLTKQ
jgi:hypothetical protein